MTLLECRIDWRQFGRAVIVGRFVFAVTVNWDLLGKYQGIATSWTLIVAAIVIAAGAWLIFQFKSWFRDNDGRADNNLEMLTQFRDLHQQGELSEDEYRFIKSRLARAAVATNSQKTTGQGSAKCAANAVQGKGGNDNAGESGRNDAIRDESSQIDEPPNLNSAT